MCYDFAVGHGIFTSFFTQFFILIACGHLAALWFYDTQPEPLHSLTPLQTKHVPWEMYVCSLRAERTAKVQAKQPFSKWSRPINVVGGQMYLREKSHMYLVAAVNMFVLWLRNHGFNLPWVSSCHLLYFGCWWFAAALLTIKRKSFNIAMKTWNCGSLNTILLAMVGIQRKTDQGLMRISCLYVTACFGLWLKTVQ